VGEIAEFAKNNPNTAVISTVNGDSNLSLYREFYRQKLTAAKLPVMSFSINEHEVSQVNSRLLEGHYASWTYFMQLGARQNRDFIRRWQLFNKNMLKVTNDPIEATYLGFQLWKNTVASIGSTEPDKVRKNIVGRSVMSLSGAEVTMLPNHHTERVNFIGQIRQDGSIEVVSKTNELIQPSPWSRLLPESKSLETNWLEHECERWNAKTQKCEDRQ
jgi:urea transport system substrate-binding protein